MPKKPRVELAVNRIRRRLRVGIVGNDDELLRLFSRLTSEDELGPYLRTLAEDYMNLRVSHLAQDEANALELALIQLKRSHDFHEPCHIEKWRRLRAKRRGLHRV